MIPSNPACFPCVCSSVILRPDTSIGVLRQKLLKCLGSVDILVWWQQDDALKAVDIVGNPENQRLQALGLQ